MTELVHLGCYTAEAGGAGQGITNLRREETGELTPAADVIPTPAPSFLAWHPRLPVLYAVNELDDGTVSAWAVEPDGVTRSLGVQSTGGDAPCHLAVHPTGRFLLAGNYGTGSICVLPLDEAGAPCRRADLAVHHGHGADPDRQERAHVHFVAPDPDRWEVLAVDLGIDAVRGYSLDPGTGRLAGLGALVVAPPGTGPRHLARGPDGTRYLVGELAGSLLAYQVDVAGIWREVARSRSTRHAGFAMPSEVAVSRDGRFCYVANRGPDTVAVFALEAGLPRYLTEVPTGGQWPRHFALTDDWLYVANERSHTVTGLPVDPVTGVPEPARQVLPAPSPTCVLIGRHYATPRSASEG